jgi:ankyrin repeat protein
LLKDAADVNAAQADRMTALHWAAMNGDLEMAQMLIYAGANVSAVTRLGALTPLHLAAKNGQAPVVDALLKAGASATAADTYGTTPLMLASAAGITDGVSALIAHGADVNAKESVRGETALMYAAAYGRTDTLKALLAHGADWKPTTKVFDWTKLPSDDPRLHQTFDPALGGTPPDEKKPVADKGTAASAEATAAKEPASRQAPAKTARPASYADLVGTQGGLTALMFAAREGHLDAVQALVDCGADVNEVDPGDYSSPLIVATLNGRFDTSMYLLDHGADPNLAESNGATPLYDVLNVVWSAKTEYPQPQANKQQKTPYLDLMKALLAHGANPNARLMRKVWYSGYNRDMSGLDEVGATPFWRAAYSDDIDAMKMLVAYGADPNVPTMKSAGRRPGGAQPAGPDKSGLTAVPIGGPGVPPLLAASGQAYGSSFTSNEHRYAPTGMLAAVKYLVEELHADVNARDADGDTALHNAASRGDNEMVQYLVSKGADVTALNRKGQTTADMANGPYQRIQPFPQTIALLEKLGAKIMNKCVSC